MGMRIVSLSKDELLRLLKVAKAHSEQDWLLICTSFWHGLRASEAITIIGKDIQDGYLTVERLKGSEKTCQRLVVSSDPLLSEQEAIEKLCACIDGPLFPICRQHAWRLVQKYGKLAGIPAHKLHPHIFKHSLAHHCIDGGMKIHDLKKYLGHKNLSSTGAYLESDDETASKAMFAAVGV